MWKVPTYIILTVLTYRRLYHYTVYNKAKAEKEIVQNGSFIASYWI